VLLRLAMCQTFFIIIMHPQVSSHLQRSRLHPIWYESRPDQANPVRQAASEYRQSLEQSQMQPNPVHNQAVAIYLYLEPSECSKKIVIKVFLQGCNLASVQNSYWDCELKLAECTERQSYHSRSQTTEHCQEVVWGSALAFRRYQVYCASNIQII
jgi:hypothetical protein